MSWLPQAGDPGEVVIGIATDRGLFVAALVPAGYQVFAVNPLSMSRYQDRHSVSGGTADPGDAKALAGLVRTDRHNHCPTGPNTGLAEAVKVLARAHQSIILNRRQQANQLRPALRELYPAAVAALLDLNSGEAATTVLQAAPEPARGPRCRRPKSPQRCAAAAAPGPWPSGPPRSRPCSAPRSCGPLRSFPRPGWAPLSAPSAPRVMATLRNLAITILRPTGRPSFAAAFRHHGRRPDRPLRTIMNF